MPSSHSDCSSNSGASIDQERGESCAKHSLNFSKQNKLATSSDRNDLLEREITIGDLDFKTRLIEKIGCGSFGEIYLGEKVEDKLKVAVKIEPANSVTNMHALLNEGNVYRKLEGCPGIPQVHWFGLHGHEYAAMIFDLLGPTVYQLWQTSGQCFSMKTMLMLIDQMLDTVQFIHTKNFVHRDMSPNNFIIGLGERRSQIYLIDFGHAKKVPASVQWIPAAQRRLSQSRSMVGTPRFASVTAHLGLESTYRDDMEALGYIWVYLLKKKLPWQGIQAEDGQKKLELIARTKSETKPEVLCSEMPEVFSAYLNYARGLRNHEMPNHGQVKEAFRHLANQMEIVYDWKFDWIDQDNSKDHKNNSEINQND